MIQSLAHSDRPVATVARKDFIVLRQDLTVQAGPRCRFVGVDLGERIVYFYIVDEQDRLVGVVPTRRLLTAALEQRISDIMVQHIVTIPHTATVLDACEFFVLYRFLAFPVVDDQQHMVGIVDVSMFTDEVFDIAERQKTNEVFELIGFRVAQVRDASPVRVFRFRFPWLLATISSGTHLRDAGRRVRGDAGAEPRADVLHHADPGPRREREQPVHGRDDPGLASRPADAALVSQNAPAGVEDGAAARSRLRRHRGPDRRRYGVGRRPGAGHRRQHSAVPVLRLHHRPERADPAARPAPGPQIAAGPLTFALADILTLLFYFTLATLWL